MTKKQWQKMTDVERWQWVIANQHLDIVVWLDNDMTCVSMPGYDDDAEHFDFDGYIGWNSTALALLEAIGVKAEGV